MPLGWGFVFCGRNGVPDSREIRSTFASGPAGNGASAQTFGLRRPNGAPLPIAQQLWKAVGMSEVGDSSLPAGHEHGAVEPRAVRAVRAKGGTPQEQGHLFERLMRAALEHGSQHDFERVWLWSDWPGRDGPDSGVDLVGEYPDGSLCAVQCKLYAPGATVPSSAVDSFLAKAGQQEFKDSLLVVTGGLTDSSWTKIGKASKRCGVVSSQDLDSWRVRWEDFLADPESLFYDEIVKRPDQQEAVEEIRKGFEEHARGQLVMPCGTGKSLVALWSAEEVVGDGGLVLYLVPSIALLAQTMKVWAAHRSMPHRYAAICSDSTAGRQASEGSTTANLDELLIPPSTDRQAIAATLTALRDDSAMTVWFSTYQSLPLLSEVLADEAPRLEFDLVIGDEAHRTTAISLAEGRAKQGKQSPFTLMHDNNLLPSARRLYQTATPRVFTDKQRRRRDEKKQDGTLADDDSFSMDDEDVYGPEFYSMTFTEAIDKDLISDYKVLVVGVREATAAQLGADEMVMEVAASEKGRKAKIDAEYAAKLLGCWDALATPLSTSTEADFVAGELPDSPHHRHLRSAIAFTNTIAASKAVSEPDYFSDIQLDDSLWKALTDTVRDNHIDRRMLALDAAHADGSTRSADRSALLTRLIHASRSESAARQAMVLSNAQLFTEGVDVPALDAVLFLDPRRSPVQITQAVGRCMRKAPGKDYGYVVIPVPVPEGSRMSDEDVLGSSEFAIVWDVVRALRSHDDRVDFWVSNPRADSPLIVKPPSGDYEDFGEQLELGDFIEQLETGIRSKLVDVCGDRRMWARWGQNAAKVCSQVRSRLQAALGDQRNSDAFDEFVGAMSEAVGTPISEDQAEEMIAHHIVTIPVFDDLFEGSDFAAKNPISLAVNGFLDVLAEAHPARISEPGRSSADLMFGDLLLPLTRAYRTMRAALKGAQTPAEKVDLLREIYEEFFKAAMPDTVARLGIVYTPVEIVDFMLRSADAVCRSHFGVGLTAENVHVLDPFTGTGTFIYRLLTAQRSGDGPLIEDGDIARKLKGNTDGTLPPELHANEIVLLAYYIAALKIEAAAAERGLPAEQRSPAGIVLGDTFATNRKASIFPGFDDNSARAQTQNNLPIKAIVTNPPWSAGQKSAGDDNPNISYPHIEQRVRDTYGKRHKQLTGRGAGKSAGNLYVEAIRWASDRISGPNDDVALPGIVAFVHPNSLSNAPSLAGMRAALRDEFTDIYVVNLRGDAMKSGDEFRREGDKIFGAGSRNGVQITVLVRNPETRNRTAVLRYAEVPEYSTLEQKFDWLADLGDVTSHQLEEVPKNNAHDWVNLTDGSFDDLMPVCELGKDRNNHTIVHEHAAGVNSGSDAYVYSFDRAELARRMRRLIGAYNDALELVEAGCSVEACTENTELDRIKWTPTLQQSLRRRDEIVFDESRVREVLYRPFTKLWLYEDERILVSVKTISAMFPPASESMPERERERERERESFSPYTATAESDHSSPPRQSPTSTFSDPTRADAGPSLAGDDPDGEPDEPDRVRGTGRGQSARLSRPGPGLPGDDQAQAMTPGGGSPLASPNNRAISADAAPTSRHERSRAGGRLDLGHIQHDVPSSRGRDDPRSGVHSWLTPDTGDPALEAVVIAGPSNMAIFGALAAGILPDLHLMGPGQQSRTVPRNARRRRIP